VVFTPAKRLVLGGILTFARGKFGEGGPVMGLVDGSSGRQLLVAWFRSWLPRSFPGISDAPVAYWAQGSNWSYSIQANMGLLSETDEIDMTFIDDESVTLRWEACADEDRVIEADELEVVEEPAPF
jgi:hypothetical protein